MNERNSIIPTLLSPGAKTPIRRLMLALLLVLVSFSSTQAQSLSNLVFTVGTTIRDASAHDLSYVLLGAPEPQLLAGKRFTVYGKNGFATNSGPFTLRGTIFQQTDTAAINTLLNQSVALGDDLTSLDKALSVLLHKIPGVTNQSLPQKVLTAFQAAAANPDLASSILILARMHPGLTRCEGQAFSETITTTTTYEVREANSQTGVAGDVIGRVTITPGAPVILPAPGFPYQVVTNGSIDHLRIRLRWGTPDTLRRLSLLQFGFNVWRIPRAVAESGSFNTTPPTVAQLTSNTNFTLVNPQPIIATQDYLPTAGPGGPNDPSDLTTYFIADGNGHSPGNAHFPAGRAPTGYLMPPFTDGEQFYYFITARDVLGRNGLVSPGGLATACRKNPPVAPNKLSVINNVQFTQNAMGVLTNQQRLLVRWAQNTNAADLVSQYWVYRWPNPSMAFTNESMPSNYLVGIVAQINNTNLNMLLDTSTNSPVLPGPSNYWYTVRAVSQSACGNLLFSPNSAPASGVLREHSAPAATTGELVSSCGTPVAMFQNFNTLPNPNGLDTNKWNFRVTVIRRDSSVAWARVVIGNAFTADGHIFGPIYFPPDDNSISIDVQLSAPGVLRSTNFTASCVVGTYYGIASAAASCSTTNAPGANNITEAVFASGNLLLTALSSSDPFLETLNLNQGTCLPGLNVTRGLDGTVHMKFDAQPNGPRLIQYTTNLQYNIWQDLGVATPDSNGVYSIYLCPCVIAPLPIFRGCSVNLPADGNCDQHVARSGDGGAIAPIQIKFRLTPRTHEYRIYRSVNGGQPTLISQGEVLYDALNPGNEIFRTDDAMPPSAARLCYFVQLLDENGNGSPLALIGCKDVVPPKPPRPVLSEPGPIGDTANPQVALNWFCPTAGVYRFEVRIQRTDAPSSSSTGFASPKFIRLTAFKPLQSAGIFTPPLFLGLISDKTKYSSYSDWELTPPIGPDFGPGPQFSLRASVLPNVPYKISVAAEDSEGNFGDASTEWAFTWKPPPTNLTVAWPARPLPPLTSFDDGAIQVLSPLSVRVQAVILRNSNLQLDNHYPVGIRIGDLSKVQALFYNIGTTNPVYYGVNPATLPVSYVNPNNLAFTRNSADPSRSGQPLLPIVIYRQQVTNANYPRVSGNIVQVSPLIERIPFNDQLPGDGVHVAIPDQLIASGMENYTVNDQGYSGVFMYVRDQQPVISGARYHYYVVRLNDQREVSEIIDGGMVDIPSS